MFRRILLYFIFFSFLAPQALAAVCDSSSSPTQSISTKITITALYPNPNTGEKEWIELKNEDSLDLDLANYTLEDSTEKPWTLSGSLEKGESLQITGFPFQLNNTNETVKLKTSAGLLLDSWTYETSIKGQILSRTETTQTNQNSSANESPSENAVTPLKTPTLFPDFSEAFPNPAGSDEDAEWIELYNPHGESLTLEGLYLDDAEGGSSPHSLSGSIGPESYLLFPINATHLTLNNTTDSIRLLGINKEILWEFSYSNGKEGQSYALVQGVGQWTLPTPNEENEALEEDLKETAETEAKQETQNSEETGYQNGDLSESIELTEVFPNPEGPDSTDEWIELTNGGTETVNLGNWSIDDGEGGSSPYIFPDDAIIAPGQTFVISRTESKIALNNSNETLILHDFNQETIDELHYETSVEGESYAKIIIENAALQASTLNLTNPKAITWQWTDAPSPGHLNPRWQELKGEITERDSEHFKLDSQGKSWTIEIQNPDLTDELLYQVGNVLTVQVMKNPNGPLTLMHAELNESSAPTSEKTSPAPTNYWGWTLCGTLALAGAGYWKHKKSIENTPPSVLE